MKFLHKNAQKARASTCFPQRGYPGCSTRGWQDHCEIGSKTADRMRLDPRFARLVQQLFKEHARRMPSWLELDDTIQRPLYASDHSPYYDTLWAIAECAESEPSWKGGVWYSAGRSKQRGSSCQVFTLIGDESEIHPFPF